MVPRQSISTVLPQQKGSVPQGTKRNWHHVWRRTNFLLWSPMAMNPQSRWNPQQISMSNKCVSEELTLIQDPQFWRVDIFSKKEIVLALPSLRYSPGLRSQPLNTGAKDLWGSSLESRESLWLSPGKDMQRLHPREYIPNIIHWLYYFAHWFELWTVWSCSSRLLRSFLYTLSSGFQCFKPSHFGSLLYKYTSHIYLAVSKWHVNDQVWSRDSST